MNNNDSNKFVMEEKIKIIRKNAEEGSILSQGLLAYVYMAMKNYDEAAKWGKIAAEKGNGMGRNVLETLKKKGISLAV